MEKWVFALFFGGITIGATAQVEGTDWFNASLELDGVYGVSVNQAYLTNAGLNLTPVIVAVIDDGVDIFHKDLADKIWINQLEVPDNGIDDDKNGYVDDVYGWSFLGNPNGENISYENLEITRLYRQLSLEFDNADKSTLSKEEKRKLQKYQSIKESYEEEVAFLREDFEEFTQLTALLNGATAYMEEKMGGGKFTINELRAYQTSDTEEQQIVEFLVLADQEGLTEYLEEGGSHFDESFNYHYNLNFSPRSIVNVLEAEEAGIGYGNNMVWAENPEHGTHVSGIIAAKRNNDIGINGVASNARIMALRAVPNGDERDEDIANAIRYAVDNGAKIINMSFGKSYSPQHELVAEAIAYAKERDVLMVHAAGNDGQNLDKYANFPNGTAGQKYSQEHWLTIGASGTKADTFLVASFSNYSKFKVDVLAPGVEILSLTPNNKTDSYSGTSMAAPVISGFATVLRGAFPQMSAVEIKQLIIDATSDEGKQKVEVDGNLSKLKKVVLHPGIPSLERALSIGAGRTKS